MSSHFPPIIAPHPNYLASDNSSSGSSGVSGTYSISIEFILDQA
jgi:hypothetical protein